jgi:predicted esterase
MNLLKSLLLPLLLLTALTLLSACGGETSTSTETETVTTEEAETEPTSEGVTMVKDGQSDYVIVCDTADAVALRLATAFASTMHEKLGYFPAVCDASEGTYPHEIVLGAVRDSATPLTATLGAANDFAVSLVEDDLVICASNSRMLTYALAYVEHAMIDNATETAWTVREGEAFRYQASDLNAMSYFAYEGQYHFKLGLMGLSACFETATVTLENGSTMLYRLYVPYDYDPAKAYPVFINLHGVGDRGSDGLFPLDCLIEAFNRKDSPLHDAIVIVPQCPIDQFWVNVEWNLGTYSVDATPETAALKGVLTVLEQVAGAYHTDSGRYYVAGYSMGGYATWDLLARHPEVFAAAMPICGGGDPTKAADMVHIPIHTFHGDADTIVPVSGTRAMVAALEAAGSTLVTYTETKGLGHAGWDDVLRDLNNLQWLFAQRKSQ